MFSGMLRTSCILLGLKHRSLCILGRCSTSGYYNFLFSFIFKLMSYLIIQNDFELALWPKLVSNFLPQPPHPTPSSWNCVPTLSDPTCITSWLITYLMIVLVILLLWPNAQKKPLKGGKVCTGTWFREEGPSVVRGAHQWEWVTPVSCVNSLTCRWNRNSQCSLHLSHLCTAEKLINLT